jgi:hypothetical protein
MQSEITKYISELNKEFVEVVGGSFVKTDTGEIFTKTEVQKYVQRKLEKYSSKILETVKKESFKSFEAIPDQQLINNRSKDNLKRIKTKDRYDGGEFNIVYRNKINEVINMKLDTNEKLVYFTLRDFITYPSNCILINDEVPTFPQLENIVGLKERSIRKSIKSLEEKGLVKLQQSGHRKAVYVNPSYYASGKDLNIEVLQMFDLVECDENKINSYLN